MKRFFSFLLVLMLLVSSAIAEPATEQEVRAFTVDEQAYDAYLDIAQAYADGVFYLKELDALWSKVINTGSDEEIDYMWLSDYLLADVDRFSAFYTYASSAFGISEGQEVISRFASLANANAEKTDVIWLCLAALKEAKYVEDAENIKQNLDSAMAGIRSLMATDREYPFLKDLQTYYKDAVLLYEYIADFNDNYTGFSAKLDEFQKNKTSWEVDFEFIFNPDDFDYVRSVRKQAGIEKLGAIYQQASNLESAGKYAEARQLYWDSYPYEGSSAAMERCTAALQKIQEAEVKEAIMNSKKIAAGSMHTVGITLNGEVLVTGSNEGNRSNVTSWSNMKSVATGGNHTVGLKNDGTVVAVGYNDDGMCDVNGWNNIENVSTGAFHSVGLKEDGTVVAVGHNKYGQCNVTNWTDIIRIATGTWHTIGLKSDGTVVATGWNDDGQCKVSGWTDIVAIDGGLYHSVGLKADGTVVSIGKNAYGQCDVSDWTDIVYISAGDYQTVGVKSDGTVVATGKNDAGQINVGNWDNIVAISCSANTTIGLEKDGTVVATGSNDHGQCDVKSWDLWD